MRYTRLVAALTGLLALAAVTLSICGFALSSRAPSSGENSVTRLVHLYVQGQAQAGGFKVLYERLLAYRVDGDVSVARVRVVVTDGYQRQTVVLVFKWLRSGWSLQTVRAVAP